MLCRRFHGSESFGPDSRSTIGKLMDYDRIKYHTWKAAQLFSANCANKEVYFYKYVHKATYGMWIVWGVEDKGYGPSHNDDVFAMFENKARKYIIIWCQFDMLLFRRCCPFPWTPLATSWRRETFGSSGPPS